LVQAAVHAVVGVAMCCVRWVERVRAVEPAIPVAPAPDGGGAPLPVPPPLSDMVAGSVKPRISRLISSLAPMNTNVIILTGCIFV